MNMPFSHWLPREALTGGAVERALAEATRIWSDRWFARQRVRISGGPVSLESASSPGPDGTAVLLLDEKAEVLNRDSALLTVAAMMLDAKIDPNSLLSGDRDVLRDLAAQCIDDLGLELGNAFALSKDAAMDDRGGCASKFGERHSYVLATAAGETVLEVVVSTQFAIAFLKRSAAASRPILLGPLASGLARHRVALSAMLGRCEVSLLELAALAPGDVLLLDRDLCQPAGLAVDGTLTKGELAIDEDNGQLRLKLLKPLTDK